MEWLSSWLQEKFEDPVNGQQSAVGKQHAKREPGRREPGKCEPAIGEPIKKESVVRTSSSWSMGKQVDMNME